MAPKHPLQRLASPSRTFSFLLHVLGIASFTSSFRFLQLFPAGPVAESFGGNYQYLTILGLAASLISFCFGALADLTLIPLFFDIKNVISTWATPLEVLISTLYWSISLINKDLLMPPEFQLDAGPDFGFHAAPALLLAVDLIFFSPPWTIQAQSAMGVSLTLAFLYWGWVEYCFSHNAFYPYPLFELLSTGQRALLFSFSASLMTASTMVLKWLYGKVNGIQKFQDEALKPAKLD